MPTWDDELIEKLDAAAERMREEYRKASQTKGAIKYEVLTNDPAGRWKAGDIGYQLANEWDKYDLYLLLDGAAYYFYDREVRSLGVVE